MKRIVVYTSKTGFTKKYAEWIAQALECEVKGMKEINLSELNQYDQVIYGGWIMGGMVSGYDKIKALNLKSLIVFASGMSLPTETLRQTIAEQNSIPSDDFYYFEGGYAPQKVGFMGKTMVRMIAGNIKKKENKTEEDLHMLQMVEGADHTEKSAIGELIQRLN